MTDQCIRRGDQPGGVRHRNAAAPGAESIKSGKPVDTEADWPAKTTRTTKGITRRWITARKITTPSTPTSTPRRAIAAKIKWDLGGNKRWGIEWVVIRRPNR